MFKEKKVWLLGKQGEWSSIGVICEGECMGRSPEDEPLTLTTCHSCVLPQLYEALEGWNIKGKFYVFLLYLKLCFSFTVAHFIV